MDRVSYRQLQAFAKAMKLPGNMKYQVLWELVHARRSGNERLVNQLLAEQNRIRVKRRISRKAAKIEAEALGRLIRQEDNTNTAVSFDMNHENSQMLNVQTKICVASLLDTQLRYNMMVNEGRLCRNAAHELPIPTQPVYNQFSGYHYPPLTNSSSVQIDSLSNSVKLHTFPDLGNAQDNISHIEVIATDFRTKTPQFKSSEPKKPSFQIEDLIASTPSTTYSPGYPNNYQMTYNGQIDCTPKGMGTYVSQPVNISQEVVDPWKKHYSDLITEPQSVSSNGSHSSLFIDTSRLSPMSSGTISANEICDDPVAPNEYETTIETIEEVSLQPSYQTLASTFLSSLDNTVLSDVDTQGQYSHVVEEITYQENEPSHHLASVGFSKSDPLELKTSVDELTNEDSKIFEGLKNLHKSLGIHITTKDLRAADEDCPDANTSNGDEEQSAHETQQTKIEKTSSPTSELVS